MNGGQQLCSPQTELCSVLMAFRDETIDPTQMSWHPRRARQLPAALCFEHRHALMQRVALLSQLLRSRFERNLYAGAAAQRKASDQ